MEALKFSVWQLLVEAMASTSVPALIAVVGAVLLGRLIACLTPSEWVPSRTGSEKTLPGVDQLFMSRLHGGSY